MSCLCTLHTVDCTDAVVANSGSVEVNVTTMDVASASVSASVLDVHDPAATAVSSDQQTDNRLSELIVDAASEKSV